MHCNCSAVIIQLLLGTILPFPTGNGEKIMDYRFIRGFTLRATSRAVRFINVLNVIVLNHYCELCHDTTLRVDCPSYKKILPKWHC